MDEDKNGNGTDYTGEMQWNMSMKGSANNTDGQMKSGGVETSLVSQHKNLLWKRVSSVEGNSLDSISDNKTLLDISSMSAENDMAFITFSRGEQDKTEMKIQFKNQKDSSCTPSEAIKDNCMEAVCDIIGQDLITDIEKLLGVEVENVKTGSIVFQFRKIPLDFKQKFHEAMRNGQLQNILLKLQNLFQTDQGQTCPKRAWPITVKQSSHPSEDAFAERELGAPCPGITPVDESISSSIQPSKNVSVENERGAVQTDFTQKENDRSNDITDRRVSDMQKNILAAEPMTDLAKELFSSDLQLNKEKQKILLDTVSKKLSDEYGQGIISTWAGTETTSGETVLVCLHSGSLHPKFPRFLGFDVKYREFDRIERESVIAQTSPENRRAKLSEEDTTLINNAIRKHGDELFCKHTNLEAISSSAIISSDHGRTLSTKICIVLYCRVKGIIPFGESPFPRSLDVGDQNIDVDIREGYFYFYAFKPDPQRRLPQKGDDLSQVLRMGCSIGRADCPLKGTLGPFVRIDNDSIGFLTCAHVLGDLSNHNDVSQLKHLEVVQPSNIDYMSNKSNQTDRVCGIIQEIQFSEDWEDPVSKEKIGAVDAALIRITNRAPCKEEFAWIDQQQLSDAGFGTDLPVYEDGSFKAPLDFEDCGTRIIKCGASTGLRRGTLSTNTICSVRLHESGKASSSLMKEEAQLTLPSLTNDLGKSVIMKELIHVDPVREVFFELGDSGAGVFMVDGKNHLTCVGLAIGCLSDYRCVVTPIDRVLRALGLVQDSLKAFPQELMETDA